MAFWGIEIKAGKPFTLSPHKSCGRLRISQATLGTGSLNKKSLVQCNVGNRAPVILCALLPEKAESCHLELEFEEAEEVTFSVIGPGNVYLTGYFVGNVRRTVIGDDESESYGEDVGETDTEKSEDVSDYEQDSFIDDNDPEVFSPSPSPSIEIVNKKKGGLRKGSHKRLKKKYELSESDEDGAISQLNATKDQLGDPTECEKEDQITISSPRGRAEMKDKNSKRKRHDVPESDDYSLNDKKIEKKKRKNNKENEALNVVKNETDSPRETVGGNTGRTRTITGGLIIEDIEDGEEDGKIAHAGNKVTIHYTGKLKKGDKIFDSTAGKDPLKFRIGKKRVMDGLELGVEGMRVGSRRRLHIPPVLGYGSEGTSRVPPDSWLIMDVELLRVR